MSIEEITKDIVVAMIEKGAFTFYAVSNENDLETPAFSGKAVAAAYESVYAGVYGAISKKR